MEFSEDERGNRPSGEMADQQKQNCIFCHIVSGKVATKKVYEDDKCLAILDINPANPGHVLLLPKEHYAIMPLVPEDLIGHMFIVAKHISQAQLKALKAQGTTIMAANGMVAGQRAPHFMIHIIPRKEGDDVGFEYKTKPLSDSDQKALVMAIRKRANALFGIEGKEPLELDIKPAKIKAETLQAEFEEEKEQEEEPEKSLEEEPEQIHEEAPEEFLEEKQEESPEKLAEERPEEKSKSPSPKKAPAKKAEPKVQKPKKSAPKKSRSKEPEQKMPDEEQKEVAAADTNLDLISRLF